MSGAPVQFFGSAARSGLVRALVACALVACRSGGNATDAPEKRESPQASAQPALLAAATTPPSAMPAALEGGPPPAPLRGDEVLSPDGLAKENVGYTLSATMHVAEVTGPT